MFAFLLHAVRHLSMCCNHGNSSICVELVHCILFILLKQSRVAILSINKANQKMQTIELSVQTHPWSLQTQGCILQILCQCHVACLEICGQCSLFATQTIPGRNFVHQQSKSKDANYTPGTIQPSVVCVLKKAKNVSGRIISSYMAACLTSSGFF